MDQLGTPRTQPGRSALYRAGHRRHRQVRQARGRAWAKRKPSSSISGANSSTSEKFPPETFAHALRLFGPRGVVDLTELMALYTQTAAELNAFDMQLQPGQKPLLPPRPYSAKCPAHPLAQTPLSGDATLPKDVLLRLEKPPPLPKREDMDDYGKKVYDKLSKGPGYTPPLRFYSPKLAESMSATHYYLKFGTGLPDRLVEIAVLVTAREMANQYEWTQWESFGRKAGRCAFRGACDHRHDQVQQARRLDWARRKPP